MNHVRWLLLLDDSFKFRISKDTPSPQTYVTQKEKIGFFLNKVYSHNRSYHNWLKYEWKFRGHLNKHNRQNIFVDHNVADELTEPTILGTCDPNLCLDNYRKFNPELNGNNDATFIEIATRVNNEYVRAKERTAKNILLIDNGVLFDEILDRKYYNTVIEYLELDDNYTSANKIHRRWFMLHKKAQQEFISQSSS